MEKLQQNEWKKGGKREEKEKENEKHFSSKKYRLSKNKQTNKRFSFISILYLVYQKTNNEL